jgi:hypothetical protein
MKSGHLSQFASSRCPEQSTSTLALADTCACAKVAHALMLVVEKNWTISLPIQSPPTAGVIGMGICANVWVPPMLTDAELPALLPSTSIHPKLG